MNKVFKPLLLLLLCISILISFLLQVAASQQLEMVIIDVGQGDSTLIITPEGKAVLIDAGDSKNVSKVIDALEARNIDALEIVIATHPHTEHMQGLIDILERYPVNEILEPGKEIFNRVYSAFINMASLKGIPIRTSLEDLEFQVGSVSFKVLNPNNQMTTDADASSIVLSVSYGNFSALFTGDIRISVESDLLQADAINHHTILRVALHGSNYSSSRDFLTKVMPDYAVISVGKDNWYGHPMQSVIDDLIDIGARVFRTDIHGTIVFWTDGDTVTVSTEKTETIAP